MPGFNPGGFSSGQMENRNEDGATTGGRAGRGTASTSTSQQGFWAALLGREGLTASEHNNARARQAGFPDYASWQRALAAPATNTVAAVSLAPPPVKPASATIGVSPVAPSPKGRGPGLNGDAARQNIAKERAGITASIDARKRSSAGVGGRREAIGEASLDDEFERTSLMDFVGNHFFSGITPGVQRKALLDYSTNKVTDNKTTFGVGRALGDLAGVALGIPGLPGYLGGKFDNVLGTKTEIGKKTKYASIEALNRDITGAGKAPIGTDSNPTNNFAREFASAFGSPNASSNTSAKPLNFPDVFGSGNSSSQSTAPSNKGASLGTLSKPQPKAPVVPKFPAKSTSSNGTKDDDLFSLYRRMLGGYFRGEKL